MYRCDKCGGGMIVTAIRTDGIQLYCPHCRLKDQYPKHQKISYSNKTTYIEKESKYENTTN